MKLGKHIVCFAAAVALLATNASAFYPVEAHGDRPTLSLPADARVSSWAAEEVGRAVQLGFGPTQTALSIPEDLSQPAIRSFCCDYISRLIAAQQGCSRDDLTQMVLYAHGQTTTDSVFTDVSGTDAYITALFDLGVAAGRGDGIFDPEGTLTRQEAATFLARAYTAYGGELNAGEGEALFPDEGEIAAWAKDSVLALTRAGIFQGYEDGRFGPNDPYSYEQCLLTLVRLYDKMPVSRARGSAKPVFTAEAYLAYVDELDRQAREGGFGNYKTSRVDGPVCTFVSQTMGGGMNSEEQYRFVYRDGSVRSIPDFGVCENGRGLLSGGMVEDPAFSEDGKAFTCTVTLTQDVAAREGSVWAPRLEEALVIEPHGHGAGTYQVSIDVETLLATAAGPI